PIARIATTTAAFDGTWSFPASAVLGGLNGFTGSVRAVDAAGNPASTAVGPVDGATTAPVILSANGAGVSGTAEPASTITLLDADGDPVATVTAGPGGAWTVPASAVPGGLDGFAGSVRATDEAGNTAATDVGPIDGVTPVPVITGANGLGVEGTAEPGATVVLRDADGDPVASVEAGLDGRWTIPAGDVAGGLDGFVGSVTATDDAGNVATAPVGPIDGAVSLSINVDPVTADNVINAAEAASGAVTISGTVFGDFTAGATVTVTLSTGVTATATLNAGGAWSTTVSGAALAAATSVTASVSTTDTAGNATTVSDTQTFAIDTTPPAAPVITSANGVALSGTTEAGATVTLLDADGDPVATVTAGPGGAWTVPGSAVAGGLNGFSGTVSASDPAGNSATTAVGPIDGATVTPVVTAANGAAITGLAEAGATITLLDADGDPVLGAGGLPITTTANGAGVWTFPAAAVPGGLDDFTGFARATDPAGNTAVGAIGPVDGDTPDPVVTAANGAIIAGTGEPGATIALLDETGAPVLDGAGVAITAVVAGDGTWSFPASRIPGGLDGFEGSVRATDPAGNTAQTDVGPIDGTISLTLAINPVTADNVLNGVEAGQAAVTVSGTATGEYSAGDAIRIQLSTGAFVTTTLAANGAWSVTFPGATLAGATGVTASAMVEDSAGNTVAVTETRTYAVDLSTPAPTILSANGAGVSGTAEAGALITLRGPGGQPVGSTTADGVGAWSIPAANISVPLNGFSGSVQAVDAAGNTAVSPLPTVDGVVTLTLTVDPVTTDNVINLAESGQPTIAVSGDVTGEFEAGDAVLVTLANGAQASTTLAADGSWTVAFSGAALAASQGLTVAVTSTDDAGNTRTATLEQPFGADLSPPPAPVLISAGATGLTGTGEAGAIVQLQTAGGAAIIGASGQPITAQVAGNGTWTIPASAFAGGVPPGFTGRLVEVDAAGNVSTPTTVPVIDLTPPSGATTAIAIGIIAGDDIVNLAESQATVTVTGQVTGEYRPGDTVTVTVGATVVNTTVAVGGGWTVGVPGAAFAGGTVQATVLASDAAGNIGSITSSRPYVADLVGPGGPAGTQAPGLSIAAAADGLINPVELAGGVSATVTLTPGSAAGDTVTLTLSSAGGPQTFTTVLTGANITAGTVNVPIGSALSDGTYSATAIIRDPSGNASAPSATLGFQVDAVAIDIEDAAAAVAETTLGVAATAGALTSRGQTVTWAIEPGGALVGTAGGRTVLRATIDAAGAYSVTLLDALDHPAPGADTLQLPIGVMVIDANGASSGTILVSVGDGVPDVAAPVVLAPTQPTVVVGSLIDQPSADGERVTSITIDGRTFTYNTAGDTVAVTGTGSTIV
ncbi:MAG: Ig-like domain-containing protein, partial [Pseudomonadota bacterium]